MKNLFKLYLVSIVASWGFYACSEISEFDNSNLKIRISTDSISFDTVRSEAGTTTQCFRIVNPNYQSVLLSNISLGGDDATYFRLNIDGKSCQSLNDIELLGNDSIFVFVEATFPNFNVDSVCFHLDSVLVSTKHESKSIQLVSWSQDVHLKSGFTKPAEIWDSSRPYLVLDSVVIPYGETLIIKEGVKILFHENAFLRVIGDIKVEGTLENSVFFQGDRFDKTAEGKDYEHEPGQWSGLEFYPLTQNSEINYAVIKNGVSGIIVKGSIEVSEYPKITITNSIIKNHSYGGLVSYGANINCSNSFFSNSGNCIALYTGGSYNFNHITINNNYEYGVRDVGSVYISNYLPIKDVVYLANFDALNFQNSIIYGNNDNELSLDIYKGTSLEVNLNHCMLKLKDESQLGKIKCEQVIFNKNPILINNETHNAMYPDTLSPAIDNADISIASNFQFDILGNSRIAERKPDIGAVEFQK